MATINVINGQDLQAALDGATFGDTLVLANGAIFGALILRNKGDGATITIRCAGTLPTGRLNPTAVGFTLPQVTQITTEAAARGYLLQGIKSVGISAGTCVVLGSLAGTETLAGQLPYNITLDRMWVTASAGARHGIVLNTRDVTVKDSYIDGFVEGTKNTIAISSWNATGPFTITNNFIESAGTNVVFGTIDDVKLTDSLGPATLTFSDNTVYKRPDWRGTAHGVRRLMYIGNLNTGLFERNTFDGTWLDAGTDADGILFCPTNAKGVRQDPRVRNITFKTNVVQNVDGHAIRLQGFDSVNTVTTQGANALISFNLFKAFNGITISRGWNGLTISHNTFPGIADTGTRHLLFFTAPLPLSPSHTTTAFVFQNNAATSGPYGILGDGTGVGEPTLNTFAPGWVFDHNVLEASTSRALQYPTGNTVLASGALASYWDSNFVVIGGSPADIATTDTLRVGYSAGNVTVGTNITISIPTGSLQFTGTQTTAAQSLSPVIQIPAGTLNFTGLEPTSPNGLLVTVNVTIPIPPAAVVLIGEDFTSRAEGPIVPDEARVVFVGNAPTVTITGQNSVAFETFIEGQFANGIWETFGTDDVVGDITWMRGSQSVSPIDTVAVTGTLDFTLRNDPNCSGGRGYYSPNHPNARKGFTFGLPVRVIYRRFGVSYIRWTGKLRIIDPVPGLYSEQVTHCHATDAIGDLSESDVREVTVQINKTDEELLHAIFDALPEDAQPAARDFDSGVDIYPIAFDDLDNDTKGLSAAERVVTSARGRLFVTGDGTMRYINRDTISLALPVYQFQPEDTVITVPTDLSNVFNRVRGSGHPKEFSPDLVVLATSNTGVIALDPGQVLEVWLTYKDPDTDGAIGATGFVNPFPGIDYAWNSAQDGTGTDLTADVSVNADFFTSTVKLTLTNNSAVIAYKTLLQVRGIAIYDRGPLTVESYTPRSYGNRPIDIDLPYQDDAVALKSIVSFLEVTYRDLADQVASIVFYPQTSPALMDLVMHLEVAQVVGVFDPQTLPGYNYTYIQGLQMTSSSEGFLTCSLTTAPWIVDPVVTGDTLSMLDTLPTPVGELPESRIDFADIDFSEISDITLEPPDEAPEEPAPGELPTDWTAEDIGG